MLDQVFAIATTNNPHLDPPSSTFPNHPVDDPQHPPPSTHLSSTKRDFYTLGGLSLPNQTQQISTSPLLSTLHHQVFIKNRLLSLVQMRVLTAYKKDGKVKKAKFFSRWRSCTLVGKVRELG